MGSNKAAGKSPAQIIDDLAFHAPVVDKTSGGEVSYDVKTLNYGSGFRVIERTAGSFQLHILGIGFHFCVDQYAAKSTIGIDLALCRIIGCFNRYKKFSGFEAIVIKALFAAAVIAFDGGLKVFVRYAYLFSKLLDGIGFDYTAVGSQIGFDVGREAAGSENACGLIGGTVDVSIGCSGGIETENDV